MAIRRKVRRHRLQVSMVIENQKLEISARFSETTRAGRATAYLNSGEIDQKSGVETAIGCLFAPLREAQQGASEAEIEDSIATSQSQWEHYMQMARSRAKARASKNKATAKLQSTEPPSAEEALTEKVEPSTMASEKNPDALDLENEVF